MVVNRRPLKRMKRRITADLYDFFTFPSPPSANGFVLSLPFRTNVRAFLSKHALVPPPASLHPHLLTWQILFRVGDVMDGLDPTAVCLDVVEEDVARSRSVYCDQCRVVGWSSHPVCSKRYHFIIKSDGNSIGGYNRPCSRCGDILYLSESRCKSCNHFITSDDVEDWVYHQLEDTTHLLHGVVHGNGFGHLLRVNGREGGSRFLSGNHIMDFWDRLCSALGVRKVSVMDVSKKYGLEYRLLHAVTKGHPWYGDWDYEFGTGSFALTVDAYKTAVEILCNLSLSIFLPRGQKSQTHLQEIISFYQSLLEQKLLNLRDLFCFVMSLIHDAHKSSSKIGDTTCKQPHPSASGSMQSWSTLDVERVEEAMFRVLRAVSGSNWVSSRALRGAICKVASPDLLDHCLRELGGKLAAEGMVVVARKNPASGAFEYRLEPGNVSSDGIASCDGSPKMKCPTEETLMQDLKFLYRSMLHPQTMLCHEQEATRDLAIKSAEKVLDCKQFVKDYRPEKRLCKNSSDICFLCELELAEEFEEKVPNPPPELIMLPENTDLADLKLEASRTFQDVYLVSRRFQAEEILGYGGVDDSTQVKHLFASVESIKIRGKCLGKNGLSKFRMERGLDRWTVDCSCGAKDDDGERMLACDVCSVWQHTRCSGIDDSYAVPARFVCSRCRGCSQTNKAIVESVTLAGSSGGTGGS